MIKLRELLKEGPLSQFRGTSAEHEMHMWARKEKQAAYGLAQKIADLKSFVKQYGSSKHVRDHLALVKSMRDTVRGLQQLEGDVIKHNEHRFKDVKGGRR